MQKNLLLKNKKIFNANKLLQNVNLLHRKKHGNKKLKGKQPQKEKHSKLKKLEQLQN
jgi:hypothetical protein